MLTVAVGGDKFLCLLHIGVTRTDSYDFVDDISGSSSRDVELENARSRLQVDVCVRFGVQNTVLSYRPQHMFTHVYRLLTLTNSMAILPVEITPQRSTNG